MSGFQVGVTALAGPAQRFKQIGTDLAMAASGASSAAGNGSAAAGSPAVASAADVFKAGVQSVLTALGDDANLLGDKVQKAGVTYEAVDKTAMPSGNGDGGGGGPPAQPTAQPPAQPPAPEPVTVTTGQSLWSIAAGSLGPGATNAQIAAEANRWYEANSDRLGPDRMLADGMTLTAPEKARTGG